MAEEKEGEEQKEGAEPPKKSKKKLIIIIVAVVVLLAGIGVPLLLMGGKSPTDGAELEDTHHEEDHEEYVRVELEPIIVNLSENASFLKVKLSLEVSAEVLESGAHAEGGGGGGHGGGESSGLPGVLGTREPMVRDAIIRVLSSKTAAEVLSLDGKDQLKDELIDAINEATALDEPLVVGAYFTDFIIQ